MTQEKEKYLERRLAELQKEWEKEPIVFTPPIVDTGRKAIPMPYDTPASVFDFAAEEGHTTYEVVGHFDSDAPENLFQKIIRKMREEKSSQ